ncbi:C40 family peptidase [Jannaschia sp. Os4]|nr:C40 family peptidase [Jannaschia sp. Os4]MBM2575414.1 C40 family peptidase [Jannaschia sp. Os4]
MDPRLTPATPRAAAIELEGLVEAARYVRGTWRAVQQPLVNLCDAPRGPRASQLLYGERVRVIDERDGYAFAQAERDGYCGWILSGALGRDEVSTHWVAAPATHLYPKPEVKAPPEVALYFGSRVRVVGEAGAFLRVATGHYVPHAHLQPARARFGDPVGVADMFLGTPYLWGGSSRWGIDCSGLVQAALMACGIRCPRDSDQQQAVGTAVEDEPRRGDLIFWRGHVGMIAGDGQVLHANAHHMAVAYEPLEEAVTRIMAAGSNGGGAGQGSGEVVALRRPA